MTKYTISDEGRYYLDAILPIFNYDRIFYTFGAVKDILISENGDFSESNVRRLSQEIQRFLWMNEFGHEVDYVFIVDKKGEDLKLSGSLKAYEEKINSN